MLSCKSVPSRAASYVRVPSPIVVAGTFVKHHQHLIYSRRWIEWQMLVKKSTCRQPQQGGRAGSPLVCRSYSMEPVPPGLQIEVKEEDEKSDIEYDEQNKVVRIPLSALGPEGQRRTRLVLFTCNKCGGRTTRLVNPIAWEKGAVFAQCAKCEVWHVLSAPNKKIFEEIRYNQDDQQQQQHTEADASGNDGAEGDKSTQT